MGAGDARIYWQSHQPGRPESDRRRLGPRSTPPARYGPDRPRRRSHRPHRTWPPPCRPGPRSCASAREPSTSEHGRRPRPASTRSRSTRPPADPRYVSILDGRAPTAPTEVALTEQAMARIGAGLGGTVTSGDGSAHVHSGRSGRVPVDAGADPAVRADHRPSPRPGFALDDDSWLVDTPAPITWAQVRQYNQQGMRGHLPRCPAAPAGGDRAQRRRRRPAACRSRSSRPAR